MRTPTRRAHAVGWMAILGGISIAGCPTTTSDLNTVLPQAVDLLNQVTAEDVVAGFEDFAARIDGSTAEADAVLLGDEIASAIDELQEAFDSGELDGVSFELAVQEVIGRRHGGDAFVGADFFGGPFGHHFGRRLVRLLDLTDDQVAATRDIFDMLHSDIRALRRQARVDIRAVLTEDQLAELDSYSGDDENADSADDGRDDNRATARHRHPHRPHVFIRILRMLDLTDDQIAAIRDIRQQLRMDVRALHQAAREDFLALLTQEQLDILERIRDVHMDDEGDDNSDDSNDADDDDSSDDDTAS
ncbi:MAG: Spy/CpxP family protein refolding chaperone [Phycisphaerae bacterium]